MAARLQRFLARGSIWAGCALGLLGGGCEAGTDVAMVVRRDAAGSVPYNQVFQVGTHNSYWAQRNGGDPFASGPGERLLDQLLADQTRALELDLHPSEAPHEFRVYHMVPGDTLCDSLRECLGMVRAFEWALPQHHALLVLLEFKNLFAPMFDAQHTKEDLDRILAEELGPSLYRPADFMQPCRAAGVTTLTECARRAGWPGVAELQGRVLFTTMGYFHMFGGQNDIDWVDYAGGDDIGSRAAFPLVQVGSFADLDPETQGLITPAQFQRAVDQSIFMQTPSPTDVPAAQFAAWGGIVRVENSSQLEDQRVAVESGLQLFMTDTPWQAIAKRGLAYPLRTLSPDGADTLLAEPGGRLELSAAPDPKASVFAHGQVAPATTTWEGAVSVGTASGPAACLRAADSSGAGGTSVSLCRHVLPNTLGPDAVRLVWRWTVCQAGTCSAESFMSTDGEASGPGELVRFQVAARAGGACVRAEAARLVDRQRQPLWTPLGGDHCVPALLPYQGVTREGGGDEASAVAFFRLQRDGQPVALADLSTVTIAPTAAGAAPADTARPRAEPFPPITLTSTP